MKKNTKTILLYLVLIAVLVAVCIWLMSGLTSAGKIGYGKMLELFREDQVTKFDVSAGNVLTVETTELDENGKAKVYTLRLRDLIMFRADIADYFPNAPEGSHLVVADCTIAEPQQNSWLLSLVPYVILIVLGVAFWFMMANRLSDGDRKLQAFSRARTKTPDKGKDRVYFSDVAGADEEKEELREVVEFLRDPTKYRKLGARIPRGVLLVGPPGTGKTLLAKATAGEANVPFFSISGSDFVEMYVGVGASRVRDLFETAKKAPASIIFIDEIDAVGRRRGTGLGGGHDEREQTLNQLLVEMDGFTGHDGVIVIAATNRADILDPALLRPGRFDRQITVNYPDIQGREDILRVHAKGKPFEADVDFKKIAQVTIGFTGADLANLLNEAALLAARKNKALIGSIDIEEAYIKILEGTQKRKRVIKPEEKRNTAFHEAGHAILSHLLPTQDPVRQISIIPSGQALGYTLSVPETDRYSEYQNELEERICMMLGGRAAEEIVFGNVSGGASQDIQRATAVARKMVTVYGMSAAIGTVHLGGDHSADEVFLGRDFNSGTDYSEQTAALIDSEIKRILDAAYAKAKEILSANRGKLDFIAEFLVANEIMDEDQFRAAMDTDATMEEVVEIGAEKRRRSEEENKLREKAEEEARKRDEEEAARREAERRDEFRDGPFGGR